MGLNDEPGRRAVGAGSARPEGEDNAAARITETITNVLAFADRLGLTPEQVGLGAVVTVVVEVFDREDGVYVFGELGASERFQAAVADGADLPGDESASFARETPVLVGDDAERQIARERGGVIEDRGLTALAEDVRAGLPFKAIIGNAREFKDEDSDRLVPLLARWEMEDDPDRIFDAGGPDGGRFWRVVSDHKADHADVKAAAVHARATGSVGCTWNSACVESV